MVAGGGLARRRRTIPALLATAIVVALPAPSTAAARTTSLSVSKATLYGPAAGALAGSSVANAGDVNGDGVDDVLVGAYLASPAGRRAAGSAYVVFGGPGLDDVDLASLGDRGFEIRGEGGSVYAGTSVAGGHDVNGDGLDDVVVGAPRQGRDGQPFVGSAFVVYGKRDGAPVDLADPGDRALRLVGRSANGWLGTAVAEVPDMNGDGMAEVVVGSGRPGTYGGPPVAAYVAFGRGPGAPVELESLGDAGFEIRRPYTSGEIAVAGSRDVNGDGRGDVVVGIPRVGFPYGPGVAHVVFGKPDPEPVTLTDLAGRGLRISGADVRDRFASAVAAAGDANGDGLGDVLVGAPGADGPGIDSGAAYLVYGSRSPRDVSAESLGDAGVSIEGEIGGDGLLRGGDGLGTSVAPAGDANGDGRDDVLLGAPYSEAAYLVESPPGPASIELAADAGPETRFEGPFYGDETGNAVGGGGDVTGDGRPDAIVGAWQFSATDRPRAGLVEVVELGRTYPEIAAPSDVRPLVVPAGRGGRPVSDGLRWAALDVADDRVRVYDTRTAKHRDHPVDPGCAPGAVGSGLVLIHCPMAPEAHGARRPLLVEAATGRELAVARSDEPVSTSWFAVGRHWIQGSHPCYHCTTLYRNWRTGAIRYGPDDLDPDRCHDLDDPRLRVVRCPRPVPFEQREGRLRLTGSIGGPLVLHEGRRRTVLSRCPRRCGTPQLAAGRVTWVDGQELVRGYVVRTRRRTYWRVPRFWERGSWTVFPEVVRIGPRVLLLVDPGMVGGADGPKRVYRAVW